VVSALRHDPSVHERYDVLPLGLRILHVAQRHNSPVGGYPPQEPGVVLEREICGVAPNLGTSVED
jgi:hypothetical protein